jgi:hypothetical protein
MNKSLFLALALLAVGFAASAQNTFGVKAGINIANQVKTLSIPQVPSTPGDTDPFIGYQLGMFYKADLHHHFTLSTEVNFTVVGSSKTLTASDGKSYKTHEKLGYIEIPLIIQYTVGKLYFGVGPGVGFKVFSKITNFENRSFDITYYQAIDAAVNFLAGIDLSKKLGLDLRYSHGIVNLYKDPGNATARNRCLSLSLLYELK